MWAYQLMAPERLQRVDVQAPGIGDLVGGDVLLRTLAGGICGSDIPKYRGQSGASPDRSTGLLPGAPGFPMHEVVGEVLASRHDAIAPGSRVVGWASQSNALAERVVTRGDHVHTYDRSLSATDAVLIQPLACVLDALDRLTITSRIVAVIGLGPIGLLLAHAAKAIGACRVIGIDPINRAAVTGAFGIDELIQLPSRTWARNVADSDRPSVVIEAVGHQVTTLDDSILGVAKGGEILYFGIPDDEYYPLNMERLLRKNLTLQAGVTRNRQRALSAAHRHLMQHPQLIENLISHRFGCDDAQAAYDTAASTGSSRLKVVLSLNG